MLRRACRLSLEFATAKKRHEIDRLLEAYRGAVNVYIRSLWQVPGALDKETLARLPAEETRLQGLHKDQALRQALSIVSSTRESAKVCGAQAQCPRFTGMAVLCHGVTIEPGHGSFDLVIRLSTLQPRERIIIPTRKTCVLNKWLSMPGARIVQGCALSEETLVVWVEVAQSEARDSGDVSASMSELPSSSRPARGRRSARIGGQSRRGSGDAVREAKANGAPASPVIGTSTVLSNSCRGIAFPPSALKT